MSSSSSSASAVVYSGSINAEVSGASSDPLVAKAVADIQAEAVQAPKMTGRDARLNLFLAGRDHPLFHRHTNNTLDSSVTVADILKGSSCGCFMKDRSGGFADYEETRHQTYEPEGSAERAFVKRVR